MKKMYCLLLVVLMLVVVCGFGVTAYAGPCAHATKEFIMQITNGPYPVGEVHKTYYLDIYVCVMCNETVEDVAAVDVDGHTYVRNGHEHVSHGKHEIYYSCFCGSTHTETKTCYGPPCNINYFGHKPEEVDQ